MIDDTEVIARLQREVERLNAEIRGYQTLLVVDDEQDRHATPREIQILELLAQGFTKDEIAEETGLSTHTVKTHVYRITHRWGARNATHLVVMAIQDGLI